MKVGFVFIIGIITSLHSFCQSTIDSTYIKKYEQKMLIRLFVSSNAVEIEKNNKHYKPNNPLNVGVGFALKNTVVNFRTDFGLIQFGGSELGKSKVVDLQVHQYGRHFLVDLFYQNYKGYYLRDKGITLYPNVSVREIGTEVSYLFNGSKFSARAAFDQSEIQLKSAGSFILGGGFYWFKLNLENDLVVSGKDQINNLQFGVNGGYAYSKVLGTHWLLSGSGTLGLNVGNKTASLGNWRTKVYPTGFGRGSIGYRKPDWAVAFLFLIHNKTIYTIETRTLNLTSVNLEMAYVRHFNRWLKKKNRTTMAMKD
jgi:hypothetical protein